MVESIPPQTLVTDATLAALTGVSSRRIRQLAEAGTLERVERGRYELGPSIRALLDDAADKGSELQRERTRKVRADADLAELELARQKGLVAPVEQFEKVWGHRCRLIQITMMQLPQRVITALVGETNERRIKDVLTAEIKDALNRAADSVPTPEEIEEL
ncbi:type IV toxin-antitoxin system AbiEi family antitoxin domain-containing protein [Methylogaea oryzae]|uniref:AbiEi antitoxin N-terminal domain-containing protein n=1 Tax=Methylogaea oryzae TaxID=1295382 RepID=A0A8D4VRU7_9GAMM|nr:terminase small subunit [Methylogaea oryzae]BBL72144.1 hypothetical protein MoryE10_27500 [Methylogaea oryzae]